MISFDLECSNQHKFEGVFKDYKAYNEQLQKEMITCPICNNSKIKRLFTGVSIQSKSQKSDITSNDNTNFFKIMKMVENYIKDNFENVGKDFPEKVRAIHYGIEEERNIYGESTKEDIKELLEEGINVLPVPQVEKIEN